ncbi:MAG: hypothetical protein ACAI44_14770 [Candidatus Sericytochromatia bacterium]
MSLPGNTPQESQNQTSPDALQPGTSEATGVREAGAPEQPAYTADSAPIIGLSKAILAKAVRANASYILLEPGPYTLCVGFRIAGSLQFEPPFPWRVAEPLLARFKVIAGLNPDQHAEIQTGTFCRRLRNRRFVFSASFVPVLHGEVLGIELREQSISSQQPHKKTGARGNQLAQGLKQWFRPGPRN